MEKQIDPPSSAFENPPITLKDIIGKFSRARWWIFYTSVISFFVTAYITYSTPPVYESTTSVMIETTNRAQKIFNYNMDNDFKISDEIAVIKSRTIAEDVVKTYGFQINEIVYIYLELRFLCLEDKGFEGQ